MAVAAEALTSAPNASREVVAAVFRVEAGRLTAWLTGIVGDFPRAEEIVQDALVCALEQWPTSGVPREPRAWLQTVARRRALDVIRREVRYREKLQRLEQPIADAPDERLALLFMCCHPALAAEVQVALTLRAVCGLTTAEIARAFLLAESTLSQRLLRARKKIVLARVPYRLPPEAEIDARLGQVLAVIYLLFNEGYLGSSGELSTHRDLTVEAAYLAELVCAWFPRQPEPLGLLALTMLHRARGAARFGADGELVLLRDQDRTRWDRAAIKSAVGLIEQAAACGPVGPYQVQAAIAACHAEAVSWAATDWPQILLLYDLLVALTPTPVVRLNRAVAVQHVCGPRVALGDLEPLADALEGYHLYHAVRAEFLGEMGQDAAAQAARARALALTCNPAEQRLLQRRLAARMC